MDGTIVDNMAWHSEAWLGLFRDEGVEVTHEEFMETAGQTTPEVIRHFLGEKTPEEMDTLVKGKELLYRHLYRPHRTPVAGLLALLADAKAAGIKLGVATAAMPRNIEYTLDGLNLREKFDTVVGASEVQRGKPHPDIFLKVAERLGVPPERCLVFEDAKLGLEAARRAGMPSIALLTGHTHEELEGEGVLDFRPTFEGLSVDEIERLAV